jgi:tetratricopeptide (TPR) repeat protein
VEGAIRKMRNLERSGISDDFRRFLWAGGYGLAQMHAELGQYHQASAILDSVYAETGSYWQLRSMASMYFRYVWPKTPDYIKQLRQILETSIDKLNKSEDSIEVFEARWEIVLLFTTLDSTEAAQPYYEALYESIPTFFPANSFWWKLNAEYALADGRPEDALQCFKELERTGPKIGWIFDIMCRASIARAYRMLGRYDEAARTLEDLIGLYKGHYLAWYQLGQVYEELGRREKAIKAYEKFLDYWSHADPGLARVEDASNRLDALHGRAQ